MPSVRWADEEIAKLPVGVHLEAIVEKKSGWLGNWKKKLIKFNSETKTLICHVSVEKESRVKSIFPLNESTTLTARVLEHGELRPRRASLKTQNGDKLLIRFETLPEKELWCKCIQTALSQSLSASEDDEVVIFDENKETDNLYSRTSTEESTGSTKGDQDDFFDADEFQPSPVSSFDDIEEAEITSPTIIRFSPRVQRRVLKADSKRISSLGDDEAKHQIELNRLNKMIQPKNSE